jgi:septal ring factor EnvC (AmiA/AmiB activator)
MNRCATAMLLVALLAGSPTVLGASAAPPEQPPAAVAEYADWVKALDQSAQNIDEARSRVAALQEEFTKVKRRRQVRGDAKAELEARLEQAQRDLAKAEQQLPELLAQARQEGVPPGILYPYEQLAQP